MTVLDDEMQMWENASIHDLLAFEAKLEKEGNMTSEVEIKKVVLKIGKKEIELSPAEAKELQQLLNETFGKTQVVSNPIFIERPVYVRPYAWWSTGYDKTTSTYTITCNTSGT